MSVRERKRPKLDPYFEGEPHPLPLSRAWEADYKRWLLDGCPTPEEQTKRAAGEAPAPEGPPSLQDLVDRAGRRHATSIGEECVEDPFKRPPHQGGYQHITPEEWAEFDPAMAAWQLWRRVR